MLRPHACTDDHGDDDSMTVLNELEKIDDDCDKHGIQFVKIDDEKAAKDFGIDSIPAIVYFERQIPNVYDGRNFLRQCQNLSKQNSNCSNAIFQMHNSSIPMFITIHIRICHNFLHNHFQSAITRQKK